MFNHNRHSTQDVSPFTKHLLNEVGDEDMSAIILAGIPLLGTQTIGLADAFMGTETGVGEFGLNYVAGGALLGGGGAVGSLIGDAIESASSEPVMDIYDYPDGTKEITMETDSSGRTRPVFKQSKPFTGFNAKGLAAGMALAAIPAIHYMTNDMRNNSSMEEKKAKALEAYNNMQ